MMLAVVDSVSRILPREFEEVYVRAYARHKDQAPQLKSAFAQVICFCEYQDRYLMDLCLLGWVHQWCRALMQKFENVEMM